MNRIALTIRHNYNYHSGPDYRSANNYRSAYNYSSTENMGACRRQCRVRH